MKRGYMEMRLPAGRELRMPVSAGILQTLCYGMLSENL